MTHCRLSRLAVIVFTLKVRTLGVPLIPSCVQTMMQSDTSVGPDTHPGPSRTGILATGLVN